MAHGRSNYRTKMIPKNPTTTKTSTRDASMTEIDDDIGPATFNINNHTSR